MVEKRGLHKASPSSFLHPLFPTFLKNDEATELTSFRSFKCLHVVVGHGQDGPIDNKYEPE